MAAPLAVIVTVDGLRADAVGAYGNAEANTPFLDRLSAESLVYDFAFSLDGGLEGFFESAWRGVHPARGHLSARAGVPQESVRLLSEAARHSFLTNCPMAATIDVSPFDWTQIPASEQFFSSAAQRLSEAFRSDDRPQVGWLNASLAGPGIRLESREQYDALATELDEGIRTLFTELSFPDAVSELLFVVVGCRGYALGEHGHVGHEQPVLHEELLHVPLIVYSQPPSGPPLRIGRLTSSLEVQAILRDLLVRQDSEVGSGQPAGDDDATAVAGVDSPADCLLFANAIGHQAIRTPGWYLIRRPPSAGEDASGENGSPAVELYLKPDDRWEVNEVSSLRGEIVEALCGRLDEMVGQASSGQPLRLLPLPPELVKGS